MSNTSYLETLNKSQLEAVKNTEGPNLVLAGAVSYTHLTLPTTP